MTSIQATILFCNPRKIYISIVFHIKLIYFLLNQIDSAICLEFKIIKAIFHPNYYALFHLPFDIPKTLR